MPKNNNIQKKIVTTYGALNLQHLHASSAVLLTPVISHITHLAKACTEPDQCFSRAAATAVGLFKIALYANAALCRVPAPLSAVYLCQACAWLALRSVVPGGRKPHGCVSVNVGQKCRIRTAKCCRTKLDSHCKAGITGRRGQAEV